MSEVKNQKYVQIVIPAHKKESYTYLSEIYASKLVTCKIYKSAQNPQLFLHRIHSYSYADSVAVLTQNPQLFNAESAAILTEIPQLFQHRAYSYFNTELTAISTQNPQLFRHRTHSYADAEPTAILTRNPQLSL
jgi:uncharacterized protein Veg